MFAGALSGVANGNIGVCVFVRPDPTSIGRFIQCGANEKIAGISQPGTNAFPYPGLDSPYAAQLGEEFKFWPLGSQWALLRLGGTVSPGDRLESDANGNGVVSTVSGHEIGAFAMWIGGSAGVIIPVLMIGPATHG